MASQSVSQSGSGNTTVQIAGDKNQVILGPPEIQLTLIPAQAWLRKAERDIDILNPFCESVPLTGRDADLAFLREWIQDGGIKVATIVGQGGAGKTRLALHFMQQLPGGWAAGFLGGEEAARFAAQHNLYAWRWPSPTLIVIDYASLLAGTLAKWLRELAPHVGWPHPLRNLLLERHADTKTGWFHDLIPTSWREADRVRALLSPSEPRIIQPLDQAQDRRAILSAGLQAARQFSNGKPVPALPEPRTDAYFEHRLAELQWADPLLLLMASVVAVANGVPYALSLSRTDLPMRLAEREARRLKDAVPGSNAGELLLHFYACVVLCGGLGCDEAATLARGEFEALGEQYPGGHGRAVKDLARLLGAQDTLPSLVPDLLAEAFALSVFEKLPRQGVGVIARIAQYAVNRLAAVLIRTARDFGHAGDPVPLLWLKALLKESELNPSILSALEAALPEQSVHLAALAVEVMQALVARWQALSSSGQDGGKAELARLLNSLSNRQADMGLRAEALASIAEAVPIYRALAESNPDAFRLDLATSLNNLSIQQSDLGLRAEALTSIAEAVSIYLALSQSNPDAFRLYLAASLNTLSNRQCDMELRNEALASIAEAVPICRALAETNPDAFRSRLAGSLITLSNRQSDLGHRNDALASIAEAVPIYRTLAAANPDAFLPGLALSLNNLSNRQSDLGLHDEALASIAEAVPIRRALAGINPDAFLPELAQSLHNLSVRQSDIGLRGDALASITEAVHIYRALSKANRGAFLSGLANSLNNLSNRQSEMGLRDDVLTSITEAVRIRHDLADTNPDAFLPDLAMSLHNLSLHESEMGLGEDALASISDAVRIRRALAEANPEAFFPDLAKSLSVLGRRLMDMERVAEARDAAAESLRCLTQAFARYPQSFDGLARATVNDYRTRTEQLGDELDMELLAPYASLFEKEDEP